MSTLNENLFEFEQAPVFESEKISTQSRTYLQDVVRELTRNKATMSAIIVILIILFFAFLSPFFSNGDVTSTDLSQSYASISSQHWFGTDELGRDLWARTWSGVQFSLTFALISVVLASAFGVIYGAISGFSSSKVDMIMQAFIEYMDNIPLLQFLGIIFMIFNPTFWTFILVMSLFNWSNIARLTRGQVLKYRNQEFILASQILGKSKVGILFKHIIPNIIGIIAVSMTVAIPSIIFFEATLSYLGLGIKPPTATVGLLIADSKTGLIVHPHIIIPLAIIMGLITISFVFLANGIRDAFDPYSLREE